MSSNPNTEQSKTMDMQTAQRVEQEKMTRRAALRKLGFGAGLAAFSLLGVDDLARMVGQRMERMAGDNKVASQIAKEFQQAGVAFAGEPAFGPNSASLPVGDCNAFQNAGNSATSRMCEACNDERHTRCLKYCSKATCNPPYNAGFGACSDAPPSYAALQTDWKPVCSGCLANCN